MAPIASQCHPCQDWPHRQNILPDRGSAGGGSSRPVAAKLEEALPFLSWRKVQGSRERAPAPPRSIPHRLPAPQTTQPTAKGLSQARAVHSCD